MGRWLDVEAHDLPAALSLLTRLPVAVDHTRAGARMLRAAWAWPLVGALVGGLAGAAGALAMLVLPPPLAAGLTLAALVVLTGALHEDGLADCADGLGGGATAARALEIMKDSRVGAFGAVALVLALGLRWQGYAALEPRDLVLGAIAAGAVSRFAMLAVMARHAPARADGLSAGAGRPARGALGLAALVALIACLPLGAPGLLAASLALATALIVAARAAGRLGGQTGDVLGLSQQVTEIAMLLGLVALLPG